VASLSAFSFASLQRMQRGTSDKNPCPVSLATELSNLRRISGITDRIFGTDVLGMRIFNHASNYANRVVRASPVASAAGRHELADR
jgi:hypothetical protein